MPSSGLVDSTYTFSTSTIDPDGDSVALRFAWGDGDTSDWCRYVPSGDTVRMSHVWDSAGGYLVRAQARDGHEALSDWSAGHSIDIAVFPNDPPATPPAPTGPSEGHADSVYSFSVSTTDPDTDLVAYRFSWGNGDTSDWSNFVPSGSTFMMSHKWYAGGSHVVRARAKDSWDALSDWSDGHTITITGPDFPWRVIATVPVGGEACGVAVLPNGEFVYVPHSDDQVAIIRTLDNTVVDSVRIGFCPCGITALPSGEYVYVGNSPFGDTMGFVHAIRASDNTVVATIGVGIDPSGLAALPNRALRGLVWVV